MFDEEAVLPLFAERLRPVLDGLGEPYEVLVVDDGSRDQTPVLLLREQRAWPELRVVRLRANAGHQAALSAGLARARGAWVATLDADLQDPPELLPQMLATARAENVDVVYGVRSDRSTDTVFKRLTARAYYRLMQRVIGGHLTADAGDFRLMSRATVDAVNTLPDHHRVLRLVIPALAFPSATVPYRRAPRAAGTTKYPLKKLVRLALDGIFSFSTVPLRLATWLGVFTIFLCLIGIVIFSAWRIFGITLMGHTAAELPGWTAAMVAVMFLSGIQLTILGIMGEYMARIYDEVKGRPRWIVEKQFGWDIAPKQD